MEETAKNETCDIHDEKNLESVQEDYSYSEKHSNEDYP